MLSFLLGVARRGDHPLKGRTPGQGRQQDVSRVARVDPAHRLDGKQQVLVDRVGTLRQRRGAPCGRGERFRLGPVPLLGGPVPFLRGQKAGETCHEGEQRHGGCDPGIAPPGAAAAPDLMLRALGLVVGKLPGASEVLVLGGGQIGIGAAVPLERPRQSGPPVELGVRVVEGGPALGGHGEVAQYAVSLLVLFEPAA